MSADPDKDAACPRDELPVVETGLAVDSCKDNEIPEKRKKPSRSVCFPDDNELVTQYFEPANPWHDVPQTTRAQLAAEYLDSCRRHNTLPIDSVLLQIRELPENTIGGGNRASRLILAECSLNGAAPTDALETVLSKVQFRRLEIDHAEIDDEAAEALFDMIEYYESAMVVSITGPRQFGIRGWQAVSRLIRKSAELTELEVRSGPLCGAHAHVVARALRPHACLVRSLCLHRVALAGDPLLSLVLVLKTNSSLRELRLPDNDLTATDAQQLGTLLRFNNNIQLMDLSNNCIQDQGVGYIADALVEQAAQTPPSAAASPLSPQHYTIGLQDTRGLAVLVLWNNQLTKNCAHHLSRALRSSHSLCVLNIGRNDIGAATAMTLSQGSSLISLGLQCVGLGPDGAVPLASRLSQDNTLQRLDLRDNILGAEGLQAILTAMQDNTTLTQIDLDDPEESTNLSEDGELATISRLTRAILTSCRRNEPRATAPERLHRKISLTCHTNIVHKSIPTCSGSRLRSPAPSPAPSPAGSPVPNHTRPSVTRVTPERESSGESTSPSTPTRTSYCSTPSRFKVMQVIEPPHIQVHPVQKRPSSRFSVTRNYDSMYNPSPTPSPVPASPVSRSMTDLTRSEMTSPSLEMTNKSRSEITNLSRSEITDKAEVTSPARVEVASRFEITSVSEITTPSSSIINSSKRPEMTSNLTEMTTSRSEITSLSRQSEITTMSSQELTRSSQAQIMTDVSTMTTPTQSPIVADLTSEVTDLNQSVSPNSYVKSGSVMTNPSTVTLTNNPSVMTIVPIEQKSSQMTQMTDKHSRFECSDVSVPKLVDSMESKIGSVPTKIGTESAKNGTDAAKIGPEKLTSGTKSKEFGSTSETLTKTPKIEIPSAYDFVTKVPEIDTRKSQVKSADMDEANIGSNIGANTPSVDKCSFESKFSQESIYSSIETSKAVPNSRFSISPIPDNFEEFSFKFSEITKPTAIGSQTSVAIGENIGPKDIEKLDNKISEINTQQKRDIKTDMLKKEELKEGNNEKVMDDNEKLKTVIEAKNDKFTDKADITKDDLLNLVKDLSDTISKDKITKDTNETILTDNSDVKNKSYSDALKSDVKYKDNTVQLTHSEEINDNIVKTETTLVKNSVQVNNDKLDVKIAVTVLKESLQDHKEVKKDKTMQQIEEITEDLGNLIKEMKDISSKTKKVDLKDIVPVSRDIILKKNKSESSLDSPDLEVSRLMNKKLIGSPFCDSSSSLEISGSSMESLYTEGQIQRPIVIQESVESDSELDRRKDKESLSEVTPGNYLNMSVSSNESVSPIFGKKKKIHDSLSSLEASMSSIESNRQEKVASQMVTSADSGIEYSLQQPTDSNDGTLTHNSSLIEVKNDTLTSPKRTSSLLDVPLKTKDRTRKISWVAPSSSFHIPRVEAEKEKPSHLEKLLSLFQHPTSIFSRSQSDEERKSASNTPPRKDSSLTSSFWSWGSTIEKDREDREDSSEADSTLSERVQVSFVDESFSKKLDKTPSTDTENTLSEFQDEKSVTNTTEIVQKCSLSINVIEDKCSDSIDLKQPIEHKNDKKDEIEPARPRSFAAVLKSSGSENSLDKPSPDSGQPIDKLPSKIIRGIKENISPENTLTSITTLAVELDRQAKAEPTSKIEEKSDLAPIATIEETCDESADNTVNIPLEFIDNVKLPTDLVMYGPELEPISDTKDLDNVDLGKDALSYLIYEPPKTEPIESLAQELKDAETKMLDLSPELVIDAVEIPQISEVMIPERAKLKKANSLEDLSQEKSPKAKTIAFKIPETSPRDIPERRPKLRTLSGSSPKSLPESLNKPSPLTKLDSVLKKRKKISSLGKMAKDSLLALNMSEDEIAEYRRSYVTSVESLRSLESVSENSQSGTSFDSRCRSCLRTSQESLMSLDSITEDCKCGTDLDKPRSAR